MRPASPPTTDRFKGVAVPGPSQCHYCRHPSIATKRLAVYDGPRLELTCRINQYAPLVTWNCAHFEREPGADDQRIHWNPHLYPTWLAQRATRRASLALGNVVPWPWWRIGDLDALPFRGTCV